MIMQNKKIIFEDMSPLEKMVNEIKFIIEVNFVSPYLFRILIVLEGLQLALFSLHPRLDFIWNNSIVKTVQNILKNIQFQGLLNNGQGSLMQSLVYLCFGINLFMLVLLLITGFSLRKKQKNKQNSGLVTYGLKLLSFFGVLVKTIQPLPFFDIFLNALVCSSDKFQDIECYSGLYFIFITLSVIGIVIQVFFSFVFSMMMIDINPFSKLPFASPPNTITEIKLLLKFLVCLYFAVDYQAKLQVTLTILLTLYYTIFLVQMYNKSPFYNYITQKYQIVVDAALFWISFCSSVQAILSGGNGASQNISSFYLLIGIPFVSTIYIHFLKHRDSKYTQLYPEEIKKPDDMENFALILINLIENRQDRACLIKLEGILHMHAEKCKESPEFCPCSQLIVKELKKEDSNLESQALSKAFLDEQEKKWYLFLRSVISVILRKYNKCSKLHLLNAYLYHEKLKLKFKSLTEMMTSELFKPSLREKFSMFRYKYLIELDIIETDMRNEQNKNVDVNGIVHFENQLVIFMKSIERSVNLHLEFWRELLEESPDIEKLQIVGSRITNTIEDAQACFHNLCSIRQNNIRSLLIYGNFLKEVVNDEIEAQEYLEKAAYVSKSTVVNKQFADNENMKYSENSNTGILTMSANLDTRFYVQNTNYDFSRILGWPKHEIVDQNIKNHIMPKLIQSIHDGLVNHYIETSIPRAIGIERLITPTNKEGFLVPSILMIKILPNLEDGLQFVGFFKEKDEIYCHPYVRTDNFDDEVFHYLVYKLDTNLQKQTIVGITQGVYDRFGIPTSLINNNSPMSNQFTIDLIMPSVLDPKIIDEMQTESGAQVTLDTTIIDQLFLISQESEENEIQIQNNTMDQKKSKIKTEQYSIQQQQQQQQQEEEAEDKKSEATNEFQQNKKYKKCEVNVWLEEEFNYKDTTIHIIKFIEIFKDGSQNEGALQLQQGEATIKVKREGEQINHEGEVIHEEMEHYDQDENEEAQQHSNMSANSQDYEELRQLKDIKTAISEKTKPKTIKILQRTVILICIFLFILSAVDLSYKFDENDQMREAMNAIYYAYNRHSIMADINYLTRKVWYLQNDYLTPPTAVSKEEYGNKLKQQLDTKVKQLNEIQFNQSKAQMSIEKRKGGDLPNIQIDTMKLLPNGVQKSSQANFTDSLNVFMAEAGGLANTTLSDFQDAAQVTPTKSNFFSVNYNGIYPLRTGSEEMAIIFYDFFYDQISSFKIIFLIIMVLGIVVLSFSQFILLPIVFSVQKTNAVVLSYFAIVPMEEIQKFSKKCEKFLKIFIERRQNEETIENEIDEKSMIGVQNGVDKQVDENGENSKLPGVYIIANDNNNNPNNISHIQNPNNQSYINNLNQSLNQSYNIYNPQEQGLVSGKNQNTVKNHQTPNGVSINPSNHNTERLTKHFQQDQIQQIQKLQQEKIKEEEEERKNEDEENQRQKILNAKDHKKKYVILQFAFLTVIFMLYFILNYAALEMNYQNNMKTLFSHTKYTRERPSLLKYYFDFIQEGLANLKPILDLESSKTLQSIYSEKIQSNDDVITSSFKNSFPNQFSTYKTNFDDINYGSVCQNSQVTISSDQQLSCKDVSALNNGLQRIVTQIGVNGNSILAKTLEFDQTTDRKTFTKQLLSSSPYVEIENMMAFVSPTLDQLNDKFWIAYKDYLDFKNMIDKLCFALFVIFIFFIFLFIWNPYLGALIKRIWMTKGVLNMIPIEIILKHEKLRQAFTAGDILSAVK